MSEHCKASANKCHGIMECFCECEKCLEADRVAGYDPDIIDEYTHDDDK